MTKHYYAFKGYGSDDQDLAQLVGERLAALIDEKKEHVTPDEIVADARKKDSPLHTFFTWDENAAADKWRKKEAKSITGALRTATPDGEPTRTRAFVYVHHPEHDGKKVLLSTRSAMARQEFREEVIEQAVKSLLRSLSSWTGLYGNNPALRRVTKNVDGLRKRIERELMATI